MLPIKIKGIPGSPEKVTGTARVIRTFDQIDQFNPKDILVTEATNPGHQLFMPPQP